MSVNKFLSNASKTLTKKAQIKEIDIEEEYCKYASYRKCKALKIAFVFKKGFPDRTTLCPGARILFIEFKKKGKSSSPIQIKCRKLLEHFGFEYHVCDKIGQAEKILDKFLNSVKRPSNEL